MQVLIFLVLKGVVFVLSNDFWRDVFKGLRV